MAASSNSIGLTNAARFIPEVWTARVIDEYIQASVVAPLVDTSFEPLFVNYGDTLVVPHTTKATVLARSHNTDLTRYANTETSSNLSINKDYYTFRILEPMAAKQSVADLLAEYTKLDAKAMAYNVDVQLCALFSALNANTRKGTLLVDVTDDNLLDCVQALDDNLAPREDRSWIICPATWNSLMQIDKFVHLDYVKPKAETAVERAQLNRPLYGAPVYVTTAVEDDATNGHNNVLLHKEAIMMVRQQEPKVKVAYDTRMGADSLLIEMFYGVAEKRETNGICLQGK